jgi:hypothetical protein
VIILFSGFIPKPVFLEDKPSENSLKNFEEKFGISSKTHRGNITKYRKIDSNCSTRTGAPRTSLCLNKGPQTLALAHNDQGRHENTVPEVAMGCTKMHPQMKHHLHRHLMKKCLFHRNKCWNIYEENP